MTDTKTLVTELMAAWNAHDPDKVESFYTSDCEEIDVAAREPFRGSAMIRKLMKYYLRGFPDVVVSMDELICNGDQAALVWTFRGTHQGRFMNIPPTGRRVEVRGTTTFTVCEGRIHRVLRIWDLAGLLRGIGLLPEL
jgi:steroid delta-isomerase-like uncharacterized protein